MSEEHTEYRAGQEPEPLKVGDRVRVEGVVVYISPRTVDVRMQGGMCIYIPYADAARLPRLRKRGGAGGTPIRAPSRSIALLAPGS